MKCHFAGAKVRISEQNTKGKRVFLLFSRAKVPSEALKGTKYFLIHCLSNIFF